MFVVEGMVGCDRQQALPALGIPIVGTRPPMWEACAKRRFGYLWSQTARRRGWLGCFDASRA